MTCRGLCVLLSVVSVLGAGCAHVPESPYVWADELPAEPTTPTEYVIARGDVLSVRVWNEEGMSARPRVREDGRITLPFLNDVQAAGYTPDVLARQLQTRLKDFIARPVVSISLEERRPVTVSVVGEVVRPGSFTLEAGSGVLHALANAGGLTQFAAQDRIYVLRQAEGRRRIRFRYPSLVRSAGPAATFRLENGDVLVVE